MIRHVVAILCAGLIGVAEAQEVDTYQQAQLFLSQLTIKDGGLAWAGLALGGARSDAERRWGKKFVLASRAEGGRNYPTMMKNGVGVRLTFEGDGGPEYFTEVCTSAAGNLSQAEVDRLRHVALQKLPGLSKPDASAPADEPLSTEESELAIGAQKICARIGAAF